MKSYFLISFAFAVFVISTFAAPQSNETEKFDKDAEARKEIAKELMKIQMMFKENFFASAIMKSIDQECMFERYKKHNNLIDEYLIDEADEAVVAGIKAPPLDALIVFANIALTCSNKLDGLLVFLFDSLFSYSSLLDVFRDDEPFKQYLDKLQCYNNYAVENKFLDATFYPKLNYQLVNNTAEDCKRIVNEGKDLIKGTIGFWAGQIEIDKRDCLSKEVISTAEKMFLKYVLLVPVGLSDDQKKLEKDKFIKDTHKALENLLVCHVVEEDSKENEINTAD